MSSTVDTSASVPWSSSFHNNRGGGPDVYKPVSFKPPQQSSHAANNAPSIDKFPSKNAAVWSPSVVSASPVVANGNVTSTSLPADCPNLKGPSIWKPTTLPKTAVAAAAAAAEHNDDVYSGSLPWTPQTSLQQNDVASSDGQDTSLPEENAPKLSVKELRQMWSGVPTMMTDGGSKGKAKVKAPSATAPNNYANSSTVKSDATITFSPIATGPPEHRPRAFSPPPSTAAAAAAAAPAVAPGTGRGGDRGSAVDVQVGGGSRGSSVFRELENCLSDEWWDSLFATYNVDSRDTKSTTNHDVVRNGVLPYETTHNTHASHNQSFKPSANDRAAVTDSTAAVLRLSNVLQKAPADVSRPDVTRPNHLQGLNSVGGSNRKLPPPTLPKDREKIGMSNSAILQQWKADMNLDLTSTDNKPGPRTDDYQRRKIEVTKTQSKVKDDLNHNKLNESGNKNTSEGDNTPKPVKFDGIGPTDKETGVPIATRTSIDEANRKDWYRTMYKSLHKVDKPTEVNPFLTAAYVLTEPNSPTRREGEFSALGSPNSAVIYSADREFDQFWYPTDAKYRPQRYKNQPRRIEDYEPGCSSLASKQVKTCESERLLENVRFAESDAEADYRTCSERTGNDGSRPSKKSISRKPVRAIDSHTFRQHWDTQNRRRRDEVERVIEAERRKRFAYEQKAMESQRHSDFLTPAEKSAILLNRFEDDDTLQTAESLERPEYRRATKIRGKARALYNFRAQNSREMSLKKGDTVYLLRQVDHNWYKGERHGSVGIFPVSYVEVILSLDEAQVAAGLKEGRAYAKYNFRGLTNKELSLCKGDIVKLIRRIDDNWYEARVNGRQGIVPEIYIELLREPETPFITPMSSRAATPLLGNSCGISPASSVISLGGPEIPSAPMSPWMSDFYDSEMDTDRSPVTSLRKRKPDNGKVSQTSSHLAPTKPKLTPKSAANYLNFRSQNILDQGPYFWPASSEPSTLERASTNQKKKSEPRDLFELAQSRRKQGSGEPWETGQNNRSQSLPRGQNMAANQNTMRAKSSSPAVVRKQLTANYVSPAPVYSFERCRALFPYKPRHIDELELQQGDLVEVMEKCDDGWYVGTSVRTNEFGTFPGNYVKPENDG